MASDAKLRTIAGLSRVWDGLTLKRVRAGEIVDLPGRRIGMHLMIQPKVAAPALTDAMLTDQGFLSRVLLSYPESRIGKWSNDDPPSEAEPNLRQFQDKSLSILEEPFPLVPGMRNELQPRVVPFSAEAKDLFRQFTKAVGGELLPGGEYESIQEFASKLPEHAARLGATIAAYRNLKFTELSGDDFLCGMRLAAYYASEAKRIFGIYGVGLPAKPSPAQLLEPAQRLLDWITHKWAKPSITLRELYTLGPSFVCDRQTALLLAELLVEHSHLEPYSTRRKDVRKWLITGRQP
jgi:hypothetical protein